MNSFWKNWENRPFGKVFSRLYKRVQSEWSAEMNVFFYFLLLLVLRFPTSEAVSWYCTAEISIVRTRCWWDDIITFDIAWTTYSQRDYLIIRILSRR